MSGSGMDEEDHTASGSSITDPPGGSEILSIRPPAYKTGSPRLGPRSPFYRPYSPPFAPQSPPPEPKAEVRIKRVDVRIKRLSYKVLPEENLHIRLSHQMEARSPAGISAQRHPVRRTKGTA